MTKLQTDQCNQIIYFALSGAHARAAAAAHDASAACVTLLRSHNFTDKLGTEKQLKKQFSSVVSWRQSDWISKKILHHNFLYSESQ